MLILAVETSTPRSSVALVDRDGVVAAATLGVPRRHGEFVGSAVAFALEQAGRSARDVTGVAVGTGPGLYTGLRVGMAFAQAFAQARRLPVVGMSGLDVLAHSMRHSVRPVLVVLDARRGQVYWARYDRVPGGVQRAGDLQVGPAEDVAAEVEMVGGEVLVVGDGTVLGCDALRDMDAQGDRVTRAPLASDLGQLALPRFEREETLRAGELEPVYLRRADATIGWQQRGRLQGGSAG